MSKFFDFKCKFSIKISAKKGEACSSRPTTGHSISQIVSAFEAKMSKIKKKYDESRKEGERLRNYVAKIEEENVRLKKQLAEEKNCGCEKYEKEILKLKKKNRELEEQIKKVG